MRVGTPLDTPPEIHARRGPAAMPAGETQQPVGEARS
jgi:hypothetical protein